MEVNVVMLRGHRVQLVVESVGSILTLAHELLADFSLLGFLFAEHVNKSLVAGVLLVELENLAELNVQIPYLLLQQVLLLTHAAEVILLQLLLAWEHLAEGSDSLFGPERFAVRHASDSAPLDLLLLEGVFALHFFVFELVFVVNERVSEFDQGFDALLKARVLGVVLVDYLRVELDLQVF